MIKILTFFALILLSTSAIAAKNGTEGSLPPIKQSKFVLTIGGFYSISNNMMVDDPSLDNGFGNNANIPNSQGSQLLSFFEASYYFNKNHSLHLEWKELKHEAAIQQLSAPIKVNLNGKVYDIQNKNHLETNLDLNIVHLRYNYKMYQHHNYNLDLSLGIHSIFINTAFNGDISTCIKDGAMQACDNASGSPTSIKSDAISSLPDIGLFGSYRLSPRFNFIAHAQYFYIKDNDLKGSLYDISAGISGKLSENWRLTAAVNYYKVNLKFHQKILKTNSITDYDLYYKFIGPMLSLSYQF